MTAVLRIATRRSPLALWQARHVAARLRALHPGLPVELVALTTRGDRMLGAPLASVGGKGLFVKELEHALLDGRADIAVHSMKDVTVEVPAGLEVCVVLPRADPRDALVSPRHPGLAALPPGARVGTSSLRRKCQLRALRPDLVLLDLRGSVNTRLAKLDRGEFDAIVLACAGLERLGLTARIAERLAPEVLLPAIGQGTMGIECREGDTALADLIASLNHPETALGIAAERGLNRRLGGGCQVPVAGYARRRDGALWLRALVARIDGSKILRAEGTTLVAADGTDTEESRSGAESLGRAVAESLIAQGADAILDEIYAHG